MGEISTNNQHQIIFPGVVLDYNDPMMLGRIRARPEKQIDYEATIKATNFNEDKDKWKAKDPFIFLPLLPYYCYFVPKDKDEYVHLIYQNKTFKFQNQFYIPGLLSSPMNLRGEHYLPAMKYLASGDIFKASIAIKDVENNYIEEVSRGVFPEPGDNAILGRGTTDLVLKPEEVLIRAGKTNSLVQNKFPSANKKQAFIQLSNFTQKVVNLPTETEIIQEFPVVAVKRMIVWNILNLESLINFTGNVKLYEIIPNSELINTKNFTIETIGKLSIGNDYKDTGIGESFVGKSFEETIVIINKFIEQVFNNSVQTKGNTSSTGFPIVVTPSEQTYQKGNLSQINNADDLAELNNYINFLSKISISSGINKNGFFLISDNNNGNPVIGIPPRLKFIDRTPQEIISEPITYGVVGAQKLYLLSHDSKGPKGKIDLGTSIYGLEQNLFTKPEQNIELQTYPTVRGDQLILLLRKMMAFITGHVHPISTIPPVPVAAGNGQTSTEIDALLANAENDILNQNIRIN